MAACDPQSFVHVCRKPLDYSRVADQYTVWRDKEFVLCSVIVVRSTVVCCWGEVYSKLPALPAAFPEILACLCVALTLPVESATAECSFSAMRRIKTHLRASMSDIRLSNLALIAVEPELSEKLTHDPAEVITSRLPWQPAGIKFTQVSASVAKSQKFRPCRKNYALDRKMIDNS